MTKHAAGNEKQRQDVIEALKPQAADETLEEIQEKSKVINLLNATQSNNLRHFISIGVRQDGTLFIGTTTDDLLVVGDMLAAVIELANLKTVKAKKVATVEAKMKKRKEDAKKAVIKANAEEAVAATPPKDL